MALLKFPAYVLAGGASRRFGADKARAVVAGSALLEHAARSVRHVASPLTVVAASPGAYEDLGFRTIADRVAGRGPLGGLEAALADALCEEKAEWALVTACDWLGFRSAWVDRLIAELSGQPAAGPRFGDAPVVAFRDERWEPFPALYRTSLIGAVTERLRLGEGAVWRLIDDLPARAVPLPDGWDRARRMNRPDP